MKKYLEKYKAYQASKASQRGQKGFEQKVYHDLLTRVIIRHMYGFSWVENEANRQIHTYLNNEVRSISRNMEKVDHLKLHA